jgi:hypothetical protein
MDIIRQEMEENIDLDHMNIIIINLHDALMKKEIKEKGFSSIPLGEVPQKQMAHYKIIIKSILKTLVILGYIK